MPRDWGRANFHVRNVATNFTGGLKADLGGNWKADAYYERGETTQRIQTRSERPDPAIISRQDQYARVESQADRLQRSPRQ